MVYATDEEHQVAIQLPYCCVYI